MATEPISLILRSRLSGGQIGEFLERRLGLTLSGGILLLVAVMGWILARVIGSRAMFLLAYGLVLVLISSRLLALRKPLIEAERSRLPTRVRESQEVVATISITAKRRLSNLIIEDELPALLGKTSRIAIPQLRPQQTIEHTYGFRPRVRGVFDIGPLVASWSDPFGLTRRRFPLAKKTSMIVHPTTEMVGDRVISRAWEDPPIRPPVSKPWPTGFEFYGMRDYVSGDDPRRIIWRATARTMDVVTGVGRYLVREAEQGITDRVMLILDTDIRNHSPGALSDTFETAVRTVASLGVRHLIDGMSLSLEGNSRKLADALRTRGAQIPFLDQLAKVGREKAPLTSVLERVLMHPRRDTHLVLITPHVDELAAARIGLLLRRGFSMLVGIVMWEETDPASIHRVASLGCNVVEIGARDALGAVFQRVVAAGARKQ